MIREYTLPIITIESGELSSQQKIELIDRLMSAASNIMHIPEDFFMVTIKELPDENIGIGGKTIDIVKKEYIEVHKSK